MMMDESPTSAPPNRNVNGLGLNGGRVSPSTVPQLTFSEDGAAPSGQRDPTAEVDMSQVGILMTSGISEV